MSGRTRARGSGGANKAVGAATMLPLALGLAVNFTAAPPTGRVAPSAIDASSMTSAALVAANRTIPRLGLAAPASEVLETWEQPKPNKSRLGSCGWYGSKGADKETNQRKNRTDLPP